MVTANVIIRLKPGISDPEGSSTLKALHLLGFPDVAGVHTARIWNIALRTDSPQVAREQADRICRRLLTNPVIHDYSVEIQER